MLLAYLPHVRALPITFQQMLCLQGRDPKFESESAALQKRLLLATRALFLMSVGALVLFGFVMTYKFGCDYGWQVAVAVLYCDFACYMHTAAGLNSNPMTLHILSLLSRMILFIGWHDHWFAAVSVNFVLFVACFIYAVVNARHPVFSKDDALDSVVECIERALQEKRDAEAQARVQALNEAEEQERQEEERKHAEQHALSMRAVQHNLEHALDSVAVNVEKSELCTHPVRAVGRQFCFAWRQLLTP
jgi:hypothetical protein